MRIRKIARKISKEASIWYSYVFENTVEEFWVGKLLWLLQ